MIAGETSRAYQETFTINLVSHSSSSHPLAFHLPLSPFMSSPCSHHSPPAPPATAPPSLPSCPSPPSCPSLSPMALLSFLPLPLLPLLPAPPLLPSPPPPAPPPAGHLSCSWYWCLPRPTGSTCGSSGQLPHHPDWCQRTE